MASKNLLKNEEPHFVDSEDTGSNKQFVLKQTKLKKKFPGIKTQKVKPSFDNNPYLIEDRIDMKVYESSSGVIKLNKKSSAAKLETKSSAPKLDKKSSMPKIDTKRKRKNSMLITPVSYPEPKNQAAGPFRRDRGGPTSQSVDFATI